MAMGADSAKRAMSDKKSKRLANKKRKIEAFLDLVKDTDGGSNVELIAESSAVEVVDPAVSDAEAIRKLKLKLQKEVNRSRPKIVLTEQGIPSRYTPSNSSPSPDKTDAKVSEIDVFELQAVVLACFLPTARRSVQPTCCAVLRNSTASKVAVFVCEGDATFNPSSDEAAMFQEVIRFKPDDNLSTKMLNIPVSNTQMKKLNEDGVKPDQQREVSDDEETKEEQLVTKKKKSTKKRLLLSMLQMKQEGFPMPGDDECKDFVPSKDSYEEVTDDSPMYGLDCEMVMTTAKVLEVARVSITDEKDGVVYDTFVRPTNRITDYLTRYSGVTKAIMDATNVDLATVQKKIKELLPADAILCGQSLDNDLKCLKMFHPYVIDTSVIYNLSGIRHVKTGLKILSARFLKEHIQMSKHDGHCSVEDAKATLKLVQLKLTKDITFGDNVMSERRFWWDRRLVNSLSLGMYMSRRGFPISVFYDYVDLECNRFVSIYSGDTGLKQSVAKCIASSDKVICLVITSEGLCYIHY